MQRAITARTATSPATGAVLNVTTARSTVMAQDVARSLLVASTPTVAVEDGVMPSTLPVVLLVVGTMWTQILLVLVLRRHLVIGLTTRPTRGRPDVCRHFLIFSYALHFRTASQSILKAIEHDATANITKDEHSSSHRDSLWERFFLDKTYGC